jgi:5-formyltetrahydrofolate cyclo-ligase
MPAAMADIELVVVPGVAFARNGARLGRGGGFYDRLLAHPQLKALRVGLCFEECLAENLPEDAHDQRMHWVVTDRQCIECPPACTLKTF